MACDTVDEPLCGIFKQKKFDAIIQKGQELIDFINTNPDYHYLTWDTFEMAVDALMPTEAPALSHSDDDLMEFDDIEIHTDIGLLFKKIKQVLQKVILYSPISSITDTTHHGVLSSFLEKLEEHPAEQRDFAMPELKTFVECYARVEDKLNNELKGLDSETQESFRQEFLQGVTDNALVMLTYLSDSPDREKLDSSIKAANIYLSNFEGEEFTAILNRAHIKNMNADKLVKIIAKMPSMHHQTAFRAALKELKELTFREDHERQEPLQHLLQTARLFTPHESDSKGAHITGLHETIHDLVDYNIFSPNDLIDFASSVNLSLYYHRHSTIMSTGSDNFNSMVTDLESSTKLTLQDKKSLRLSQEKRRATREEFIQIRDEVIAVLQTHPKREEAWIIQTLADLSHPEEVNEEAIENLIRFKKMLQQNAIVMPGNFARK